MPVYAKYKLAAENTSEAALSEIAFYFSQLRYGCWIFDKQKSLRNSKSSFKQVILGKC